MRFLTAKLHFLCVIVLILLSACGSGQDADPGGTSASARLRSGGPGVSADYKTAVQQLYISYFGRPADTGGLANFQAQLAALGAPTDIQALNQAYNDDSRVKALVDTFGNSAESASLYSGDNTAFITAIYLNLLNRAPDTDGLKFWVGALNAGGLTRANASLAIMAGALANKTAQGLLDAALVNRKVSAGSDFTDAVLAAVDGYKGDAAAAQARALLASISANTDMAAFKATIAALVSNLAAATTAPTASFAGTYAGTYSGEDEGTVSISVAADGKITGSGRSTLDPSFQFQVSGTVAAGGGVSLISSGSAGEATFTGAVSALGKMTGSWRSPEGSGSFTLGRTSAPPVVAPSDGSTSISGVVSVGPVLMSTVRAYAVNNGFKGSLLGTATTDTSGYYSIKFAGYTGPVVVEASGGTYTDPATGINTALNTTLSAAAVVVAGPNTVNITAITTALVGNASVLSGGLTVNNITISIVNIKNQIGVDPVTTTPIDPNVALPPTASTNNMIYGAQIGMASQYLFEDQTKTLSVAVDDFARLFKLNTFAQSAPIALAANNFGANDRNVNGLTSTLGNGNGMMATCSWVASCIGPNLLPMCAKKPEISCLNGKVPLNGVCVTPNTTPVDSSATTLTKTWAGPWNWAGPSAAGCPVAYNSSMSMTLRQSNTSFSGSVTASGIHTVNNTTCALISTGTYSGTVNGTIVNNAVNFTMSLNGTRLEFTGKGTLSGGVFSGTLVRVTGGSGSFNLH